MVSIYLLSRFHVADDLFYFLDRKGAVAIAAVWHKYTSGIRKGKRWVWVAWDRGVTHVSYFLQISSTGDSLPSPSASYSALRLERVRSTAFAWIEAMAR